MEPYAKPRADTKLKSWQAQVDKKFCFSFSVAVIVIVCLESHEFSRENSLLQNNIRLSTIDYFSKSHID